MMSFYKNLGYDIKNYPQALDNFSREITLPVYYDLTDEQLNTICNSVVNAVNQTLK
jgi:dTDP-4-amino-4,6-dideoxygalactose transaminase